MTSAELAITLPYVVLLTVLSGFALHRFRLALAGRRLAVERPAPGPLPTVLVQIPIYNEQYVAEGVIDSACRLHYPSDKLELQVLDDSTDRTRTIVAAAVSRWQARGVRIVHIHRRRRDGYKAGALAAGLLRSRSEVVAVFDADFLVPEDFLLRLVPHFADAGVGMVQARWGYTNRARSLFTEVQAQLLDGHFVNEQGGRAALGCFFNFNGTAGVWRRRCIDDAGGWSDRTLTEDLDLSYRAQMLGWRFVFRPDVVVPSELPEQVEAFKRQQHRWAKGSIQSARALLGDIWRRPGLAFAERREATFHLLANVAYPLVTAFALLLPLVIAIPAGGRAWWMHVLDGALWCGSTLSLTLFYVLAARGGASGWRTVLTVPLTLAIGAGLAINNSLALIEALRGHHTPFVRTPKLGGRSVGSVEGPYRLAVGWQGLFEVAMGVYLIVGTAMAASSGRWLAIVFSVLFAGGFLVMGWPAGGLRLRENWAHSGGQRMLRR